MPFAPRPVRESEMSSSFFCLRLPKLLCAAIPIAACGGPSAGAYRDQLRAYDTAALEPAADAGDNLFAGSAELGLEDVVSATLERSPTIRAAQKGWRAAIARHPQAVSLDDPSVSYTFAPLSIGSSEVNYGQVVEISQPLPFPGKRRLRGQVALAEADAARHDAAAVKLRIAQMAAHLYYELYATTRAIEITSEFERELEAHREMLTAHLAAGHAWQDDALKVEVDLGETTQRRIDLEAQRDIASAQLNELLHRDPALPFPLLPESLPTPPPIEETVAQLTELAASSRPEVRAASARVIGGAAGVASAKREFYPDFRIVGRYSSMWPQLEHELMAGLAMTIPLWRGRRHAAVAEAEATREQAKSGVAEATLAVKSEVARAYRAHAAALDVLGKIENDIMPAARDRAAAIRVGLDSGRTTFIEVLRADHDLLSATLRYQLALANAHTRRADLDIAVGRLNLATRGERS